MSDVVEKIEVTRDRALEEKMLAAVIADRNDQPRNKQVAVGPSSIGFCRELLRAQLFEGVNNGLGQEVAGETHWAAAAHVGTVMGADLERIFGERLDAVTQQRVTTLFDQLGVSISGAMDLAFVTDDQITDLKSTTDIGGILYDLNKNAGIIETLLNIWRADRLFNWNVETADGGYELTAKLLDGFSKLQYWVQISIYVVGAIQSGLLDPERAEGRLVFYDRAGEFQEFLAVVVNSEEIEMFYDIGQARVGQVVQAQELFERTNNLHLIHQLRDQTPSFCFSPKVMCPLRERCWGGSEWEPETVLESAEISSSMDRYIEGRRLAKIGEGMKSAAKSELKGIEGSTPDGRKVSWPGGRINVVETSSGKAKREAKPKSAVDIAQETMAQHALEKPAEPMPAAVARAELEADVVAMAQAADASDFTVKSDDVPPPTEEELALAEVESLEQREQTEWPDHEGRDGERPVERDPRIDAVQFVDSDPRPLPPQSVETPVEKPKRKRAPAGHGKRGHKPEGCAQCAAEATPSDSIEGLPIDYTSAAVVLERNRDTLTPAQIAYLESKVEAGPTTPRHQPLEGDQLKAALEADAAAGRLRAMQAQSETNGAIAKIRAAAAAAKKPTE